MKTILIWLFFWLAVIGCVAWYFLQLHQTQVKEQRAIEIQQHQQHETAASIAALALKYNAVTNWQALLPAQGAGDRPLSIYVSRALIQSNGQPVLITMVLWDVDENNGGYTVFFFKNDITSGMFQLSVVLKCTQDQTNQLLKKSDNVFSQTYAVVARFENVVRPKFKVSFSGVSSSSEDGEDSNSIELDASSDVFLVKGELLEAIRLP